MVVTADFPTQTFVQFLSDNVDYISMQNKKLFELIKIFIMNP